MSFIKIITFIFSNESIWSIGEKLLESGLISSCTKIWSTIFSGLSSNNNILSSNKLGNDGESFGVNLLSNWAKFFTNWSNNLIGNNICSGKIVCSKEIICSGKKL